MPIQGSLSRATAVAKWKADQQMRLLKNQNQVRDLEGQIKTQKARLADTAWTLYTQHRLSESELQEICAGLAQLQEQVQQQQAVQEAIRSEQFPDPAYSAELSTTPRANAVAAQPTCPNCQNAIEQHWKVCPRCGTQLK